MEPLILQVKAALHNSYVFLGIAMTTSFLVVTYRLFLSPLAKIPGPKLAVVTGLVEFYYDVVLGGQLFFKIEQWHEQYGPIVRISPREVHISDTDFFDELYSPKLHHSKLKELQHRFNISHAMFEAITHEEHERGRATIAPFFSRIRIQNFTSHIQALANKLVDRLENEFAPSGQVVCLTDAFATFTADIISQYALGTDYGFIDEPSFRSSFTEAGNSLGDSVHVAAFFPLLVKLFNSLPKSWIARMSKEMGVLANFYDEIEDRMRDMLDDESNKPNDRPKKTVPFAEHVLKSRAEFPDKATLEVLSDEAQSVTFAGLETTKSALATMSFWILRKPEVLSRLQEELRGAIPDASEMPELVKLQQLPYLSAVVQEGLRMSYGVSQRLFRRNPHVDINYKGYTIPRGHIFGMTTALQHRDASIFPAPHSFNPERWLGDALAPNGRPLSKYAVHFSKGPRNCIGMHLAMAELFIGVATLFRRLRMELFETERDAVDMARDCFVPQPRKGAKGVRVIVRGRCEQ